ncbi:hypothetical protein [Cupriavidus sp. YAF13]|uniref:hypothetical protein n=1 Tax=Cupriavidus sp. YAF13 TaxID=3233075 RepID=UPI003F93519B
MSAHNTKLSATVTVERYQRLEQSNDRRASAEFVRQRFDERYFLPIESMPPQNKHGFMIMAIGCLVIETLESFYQGRADTKRHSLAMFRDFFARNTALNVFGGENDWFYRDIRCGILHQSEARNGWRILRRGQLLDRSTKSINATKFIRELHTAVDAYAAQLQEDEEIWLKFKKKMKAVCKNCE